MKTKENNQQSSNLLQKFESHCDYQHFITLFFSLSVSLLFFSTENTINNRNNCENNIYIISDVTKIILLNFELITIGSVKSIEIFTKQIGIDTTRRTESERIDVELSCARQKSSCKVLKVV